MCVGNDGIPGSEQEMLQMVCEERKAREFLRRWKQEKRETKQKGDIYPNPLILPTPCFNSSPLIHYCEYACQLVIYFILIYNSGFLQ